MKVFIFTEGGSRFGYGHVIRCVSLYEELEKRGYNVEFIINGDKQMSDVLYSKKHRLVNWLSTDSLTSIFNGNNSNFAIIDSYLAKKEIYSFISSHTKKSLFIDDNNRINYPKGIVVNPSLNAIDLNYFYKEGNTYLLGQKYIILRSAFLAKELKVIRKEVKNILITMGGSDVKKLTPKLLAILNKNYPDICKKVIIGKGYSNINELDRFKEDDTEFFYNTDASQMKGLMMNSDIVISAAGQTIHELIKTETPFIPIKVIENQENNVKGLLKLKIVNNVLDEEKDFKTDSTIIKEIDFLLQHKNRIKLSGSMKTIIDGQGSQRIIDELLK